ncbi:hypothetical protein RSOLAG22IIIB_12514 [Rhizoctonia solani]|uniref:Cutinase n=1 Tax=Rhizoctonia solani TaxID=456999 RepID=A0A0K6GEN2_9AGAM|nr:hypothetical protein RSOLAG22IIIB_12514 [Rhizoctonia solani]
MLSSSVLLCLLFFPIFSSAAPIVGALTPCSDLHLVFLVGANERKRPGAVGGPLSTVLQALIPGTTTYTVPYNNNYELRKSVVHGADLAVSKIARQAAHCPEQRFAIGGYSKGALVIHKMNLPDDLKAKIVAIVAFGDPAYRIPVLGNAWPINSPVVNRNPRSGYIDSQNVATFCNRGDIICLRGLKATPHRIYGKDGSIAVAAAFIRDRMNAWVKKPTTGQ